MKTLSLATFVGLTELASAAHQSDWERNKFADFTFKVDNIGLDGKK